MLLGKRRLTELPDHDRKYFRYEDNFKGFGVQIEIFAAVFD